MRLISYEFHAFINWRLQCKSLKAIGLGESQIGEAFSDFLLLWRMDASRMSDIHCSHHAAVLYIRKREHLLLTKKSIFKSFRISVIEWGKLSEIERHVGILEKFPHHLHIRCLESSIRSFLSDILAALIPQKSLDCIRNNRSDHSVKK